MFDFSSIEPGSIVNIVYDTPLKGNETRVRVLASKVGYEFARTAGEDLAAIQKNIYSSLVGQPTNDLTAYNYMLFRDSTGKVGVAADAWVREVRVITSLTARFVVQLDNKQEKEDLEAALAARGFNDVEIEIIENAAG